RVEHAKAEVVSAHANVKQVSMKAADAQAKLAKVEQARAALDAAQLNLSYTEITAPVNGVATHKQVEPGQIVQAGQGLLVVVPLHNVWVTANFKETQLKNMRAGFERDAKQDSSEAEDAGRDDQPLGDRRHGDARDVHGSAGHVHRERGAAAYRGKFVGGGG